MDNLVSATYARNNFKNLLDEVVKEGKVFVLLRKSQPQAAIVPYKQVLEEKENWQREFNLLRKNTQKYFDKWLEKKGVKKKDLTEEKLLRLLDEED